MTQLKFNDRRSFKIVQFTDLHYRNGEAEDHQTTRLMREILSAQSPDLVVFTGDLIDGSFCRDPLQSVADAVRPIIDRHLPWAAVFGNHDDEGSATRQQLMSTMRQLPGCLASQGPGNLSGVGNYVLDLHDNSGPSARLFFLDSHAYGDAEKKSYGWIKPDQIDWYLKSPHDLPALMFFHIPLPEYDAVWNAGDCEGSKFEPVCCPIFNSGFFEALKTAGDMTGVFVGHDHTNDFTGTLSGIRLCYGRCTGFSSYGKQGFARGARVILLEEGTRNFQTHVVQDHGSQGGV